ncbi:hypothetical protein [Solimonas soli]|uniref:hypothetical protein n=1 Tax=Solimonas soli TaxID=413479 RepID=UPI0012F7DC08|nr:hypothetical protein [Solimonas soli]
MLHPNQFQINEAWIVFKLNDAPLQTEADGDFNVVALMDAASCYILGSEFVPVRSKELSKTSARRLLQAGLSQAPNPPKKLLIPIKQPAGLLSEEAARLGLGVQRVEEDHLSVFTGEARAGFKERFGGRVQ